MESSSSRSPAATAATERNPPASITGSTFYAAAAGPTPLHGWRNSWKLPIPDLLLQSFHGGEAVSPEQEPLECSVLPNPGVPAVVPHISQGAGKLQRWLDSCWSYGGTAGETRRSGATFSVESPMWQDEELLQMPTHEGAKHTSQPIILRGERHVPPPGTQMMTSLPLLPPTQNRRVQTGERPSPALCKSGHST